MLSVIAVHACTSGDEHRGNGGRVKRKTQDAAGGLRGNPRHADQLTEIVEHGRAGEGDEVLLGRLLNPDTDKVFAVGDEVDEQPLGLCGIQGAARQPFVFRDALVENGLDVRFNELRFFEVAHAPPPSTALVVVNAPA